MSRSEASAGDSSPARTSITVTEGPALSVSKIFIWSAVVVMRRRDKTVPAPDVAFQRNQPLAGLQLGDQFAAALLRHDTDLGQTAPQFDRRLDMPVDGNIERVVSRLYAVEEPLPQAKPRIQELASTLLGSSRAGDGKSRAGDSAQALMDLGSSICTPKKPACALCPLNEDCAARLRGDQETFPRKSPKKSGDLRRGAAFIVTRGDELLVRTRPEKGLLGGMTEVPGSDWLAGQDDKAALEQAPALKGVARWHRKAGVVTHVFTHFPLELVVYTADVAARTRAPEGMARLEKRL